MHEGFPDAGPGMSIGLLGGSFDPAHEGHVHVSRVALARIGLDRVWWLVSPGNPLKARAPAPVARRIMHARRVIGDDPRIIVSDIEERLGTRFTADTIAGIRALYPQVRFVWLMGADNLLQFHRWEHWNRIMGRVAVAVMARPGAEHAADRAVAARTYAASRVDDPRDLVVRAPPVWAFLDGRTSDASSTAIRRRGAWGVRGTVGGGVRS